MIFAGEQYYKPYRIGLTAFGLWPYQKSVVLRIQAVFNFTAYFSLLFLQFMALKTTYDVIFIVKTLTHILPSAVYAVNYKAFYFNLKEIKQSLEHIRLDWSTFTDSSEIKIIEKYAFEAYIFSLILYILAGLAIALFALFECLPVILDAVVPMNVSRPRKINLPLELFIDEEQYYVFYVTYEILLLTVGIFTTISTGMYLAAVSRHCCATYKIASILIQNIVTDHTPQIPTSERVYFMYRSIRRAVHIHRRSMRFLNNLLGTFHIWYLPLIMIGVFSLSCVLFRLLNAIIQLNDLHELSSCIMLFLGHVMYMFMANFLGQSVTDHSVEISNAIYNTLWYVAPLPIQKLLLFMQKSIKDHKIITGGVFVASLNGFSSLITSAISYFTVIYAMR